MTLRRVRRLLVASCAWWGIAVAVLACAQPFLSTHFRHDGWEDEPAMRFVSVGESANFEPDDREPSAPAHNPEETTIFVSPGIQSGSSDLLAQGVEELLAGIMLALPVCLLALCTVLFCRIEMRLPRSLVLGKPPPSPTRLWRSSPPVAAPPIST